MNKSERLARIPLAQKIPQSCTADRYVSGYKQARPADRLPFGPVPMEATIGSYSDLRDFGFRDQITRAGLSIPSNIAEGVERTTPADQCKFLDYARGSCGEVRTQTIIGIKVGFISEEIGREWIGETKELAAMINGLIRSIRKKRD